MKPFSVIVAIDHRAGIGRNGGLPWHLPIDLKHFKFITTRSLGKNVVIMGRKTWDSIPIKFRPLPDRVNVVITRQKGLVFPDGVICADSLENALASLEKFGSDLGEIFVIGGGQIFNEAVVSKKCQRVYMTLVEKDFSCDTFFPDINHEFTQSVRKGPIVEEGIELFFCEYERKKSSKI